MWLFRLVAFAAAIVCAAVFVPWDVGYAYFAPLPQTVQAQVDDAHRHGMDGVIVYVDQAGKAPAFYAAGWKDRNAKAPADPHALFKIASISKLYIAVAAAKLAEDKRLSLDGTLAEYLPDLAGRIANADRITLRMLLQHRSGIPNFTDVPGYWDRPRDSAESLGLILGKPADFKPGSRHSYSNTNYVLVGAILDKVLGYSHRDYIKAEILTPLGLTHTYGQLSDVNPADVVSGYIIGYDGDLKSFDYVNPGGSMVATAQDVGVFLRALNNGALLDDNEQAIYSSIYDYEHTGLLPGYQSIARYHKDIDTVVVQFVSTSGGNAWTKSEVIYKRIIRTVRKAT
ncbi:D-alanyl-D-alanine carboxypeptidase [Asticcacaulis biprosthecium C19]|uniref:D-alanyl-D-alanine carboxypeptidase n=1 Tax=Asticcacaulis biprosthecium C19 TaxID=715226 RepID=F4QKM0_9CAUL|nr:D-alanyl-D-alanine carboxypeptidase [Asticcacaulis biprosthecium C19]